MVSPCISWDRVNILINVKKSYKYFKSCVTNLLVVNVQQQTFEIKYINVWKRVC